MSENLDTRLQEAGRFSFFDVSRLLDKLNLRLSGQEVKISRESERKIRWYNQSLAGFNQKTIYRRIQHDLEVSTYNCVFGNCEKNLGHILIEGGIYNEHEMPYETCRLKTSRELTFKSGIYLPPTQVVIGIHYVDELGAPELHKKYLSGEAEKALPPKWFVHHGLEFIER